MTPSFTLTGEPPSPDDNDESPPPKGRAGDVPPGLFSTGLVARALDPPVTAQTVRNWLNEGAECAVRHRDGDGNPWFDREALQAWRVKHRPGVAGMGRGGKRNGAGNKHQKWKKTSVLAAVGTVFEPASAGAGSGKADRGPEGSSREGGLSAEELRRAIEDPTGSLLSFANGRALHEQLKASAVMEKLKAERGETIPVSEARDAWAKTLTVLAKALDGVHTRVTPELVRIAMEIAERKESGVGGAEGGPMTATEMAQQLSTRLAAAVREAVEAARKRAVEGEKEMGQMGQMGQSGK